MVEEAFSSTLLPQAAKIAAVVASIANFLIILVVGLVKVAANVIGSITPRKKMLTSSANLRLLSSNP
jgi:hypothetical protein